MNEAFAKGLMKMLGPMIEQFKPQLDEWLALQREQVELQRRIETKLDTALKRLDHHELKLDEFGNALGVPPDVEVIDHGNGKGNGTDSPG